MLSCIRFVRFLSLFSRCHQWIKIITCVCVCVCFLLLIYGYAAFVADGLTFSRTIVSMLSVSHYLTFLFVIPSCQEKSGVRLSRFVNSKYLHLHPLSDCAMNLLLLFLFWTFDASIHGNASNQWHLSVKTQNWVWNGGECLDNLICWILKSFWSYDIICRVYAVLIMNHKDLFKWLI